MKSKLTPDTLQLLNRFPVLQSHVCFVLDIKLLRQHHFSGLCEQVPIRLCGWTVIYCCLSYLCGDKTVADWQYHKEVAFGHYP